MPKIFAWFITFNFINIAWVFFRAKEWDDAIRVLDAMFSLDTLMMSQYLENIMILAILVIFVMVLGFKNSHEMINYPKLLPKEDISWQKTYFYALILFVSISAVTLQKYTEFIYFNF
jgi:amino acid transporter